jgi:hypothetical protein
MRTGVSTGFLALVAAEADRGAVGTGLHDPERGPVLPHRHHDRRHHRDRLLGALLDQIANRAGRALTSWSDVRREP